MVHTLWMQSKVKEMGNGSIFGCSPTPKGVNNMKRIIVAIVLGVLLLSFATPVLAGDPPDTQVQVSVSTPGDVDVDVDINAGGDVDITVDGVDLKETAGTAQAAYNKAFAPKPAPNGMWEYTYYWDRTGLKAFIEGRITALETTANILANSQVKLIEQTSTNLYNIEEVSSGLKTTTSSLSKITSELKSSVKLLQEQDEITWNQLMYGAEAHLAILNTTVEEQATTISNLQTKLNETDSTIEVVSNNNLILRNYVDYLQRQYLYYFWILGGACLILLIISVYALVRTRR